MPQPPRPAPLRALVARRWPELAASAAGLLWFLALLGSRPLRPTDLDWLAGDQIQHVLGWLFFRRSGWAFPPTHVAGLAHPVGTTVSFTDSNPLVALALRPLSPLLPLDFQYVGPWMALCFALQGWFGARLAGLHGEHPWVRAVGGALLATAPVLAFRARIGHDTLCAQFLLLVALHAALAPHAGAGDARRAVRRLAAAALVAALVHPYLGAMVLAVAAAALLRLAAVDRALARGAAWRALGAIALGQVAVHLALGNLTSAPSHSWGFGQFSADLLAPVSAMGTSRLLPTLPRGPMQYEGYQYLGAGALALVAVAAALVARRPPSRDAVRRVVPVAAVALLLAAFALSQSITVAGREVVDLHALYRPLYPLAGPFRTSGRFGWPLYWLVLGGSVAALPALVRPRTAALLLAGALALQLVDVSPLAGAPAPPRWRTLGAPEWALARGRYDHLALVPPQVVGVGRGPCDGAVYGDLGHYAPFAYEAYALGMTVNSAFLARGSPRRHDPACAALLERVRAGALDPRTVYVVDPSEAAPFLAGAGACGRVDGQLVCVARANDDPFRAALVRAAP